MWWIKDNPPNRQIKHFANYSAYMVYCKQCLCIAKSFNLNYATNTLIERSVNNTMEVMHKACPGFLQLKNYSCAFILPCLLK